MSAGISITDACDRNRIRIELFECMLFGFKECAGIMCWWRKLHDWRISRVVQQFSNHLGTDNPDHGLEVQQFLTCNCSSCPTRCSGHNEPCVARVVKKKGDNFGGFRKLL